MAPAARLLWTLEVGASGGVATVVAFALGAIAEDDGHELVRALGRVGPWVVFVAALVATAAVPALLTRRWRWRLDDVELDLRHGLLTDVRTIVPIARVQHVDVRRSLFAQLAGVAAVVVHTAAGATEIPALVEADATRVRDRIAGLIRTPDDD